MANVLYDNGRLRLSHDPPSEGQNKYRFRIEIALKGDPKNIIEKMSEDYEKVVLEKGEVYRSQKIERIEIKAEMKDKGLDHVDFELSNSYCFVTGVPRREDLKTLIEGYIDLVERAGDTEDKAYCQKIAEKLFEAYSSLFRSKGGIFYSPPLSMNEIESIPRDEE